MKLTFVLKCLFPTTDPFPFPCSYSSVYSEKMSSKLLLAMNGLIDVFYLYSGKEGDKYKLSKPELKNLLQVELAYLLEVSVACFLLFWFVFLPDVQSQKSKKNI